MSASDQTASVLALAELPESVLEQVIPSLKKAIGAADIGDPTNLASEAFRLTIAERLGALSVIETMERALKAKRQRQIMGDEEET